MIASSGTNKDLEDNIYERKLEIMSLKKVQIEDLKDIHMEKKKNFNRKIIYY